jgi:TPR repeat protein
MEIHGRLVKAGYPAAFDNLGWLLITEKNNYSQAVRMFQRGVELGDPDSMVSLAEMLDQGLVVPRNSHETKMELYARAARLGHAGAEQALREADKKRPPAIQFEPQRQGIPPVFRPILRSLLHL